MSLSMLDQIRELVETSTMSKSKLAGILSELSKAEERGERPKREKRATSPVTIYFKINRRYTCSHCGHKWESVVEIKKGDNLAFVNSEFGVSYTDKPANVECSTASCQHCPSFIKRMEREELEERYSSLLNMVNKRILNKEGIDESK